MAKRVGRRNKYDTHVEPMLDRIPKWRRQGLTEEQIAKRLEVSYSSFNKYKVKYPELIEALKTGREELIENLEESVYRKGMGYEYTEVKVYKSKDEKGNMVVREETFHKVAHPDTGALAFALKNLAPEKWRDRQPEILPDTNEQTLAIADLINNPKQARTIEDFLGGSIADKEEEE